MYCVIIKQWICNDVCIFTSWNPTYPPPHDSLGLHNQRKQNAFSSSCFRHHLFSPLRHLRLISWSFLLSLPKVKMIPNVKKIPMREAPDLFIACNKSRIGRAKLIRTKYRSGKIHFPRFHKSLVWPFSWTNNSKKVWRYKVPSMYHLLGHWCLFHIILVFTLKSTKPMPF